MSKSLEHRVGQMLMAGFDGFTAPEYLLDWLREGRLGGAILFARNIDTPEQVAALCASLHDASPTPILIGIDQEGGTVARLRNGFSESPGAMALSSIPQNAEKVAEQVNEVLAVEMQALGINWAYSPVVDVTYNANNPTVGTRSYGSNTQRVASMSAAAMKGLQSNGVAACAKHFPGLGDTAIDTHLALPRLNTSLEHVIQHDLAPYRHLIEQGLASIMTTHTIFEALDSEHPATLSAVIVQKLIREELGFEGVVTTDCMEMKAIDDNYGVAESVVRAANAGIDIILFSHTPDKQESAYDHLLAAVRNGDVSEAVVDAANERIQALKSRFPRKTTPLNVINSEKHQDIMRKAAQSAISMIRVEPFVLPLRAHDSRHVVMVEFSAHIDSLAEENKTVSQLAQYVQEYLPAIKCLSIPTQPTPAHMQLIEDQHADVLIIAARNAHLYAPMAKAVQQMSNTDAAVILLALRNPYDAALIDRGTVICTAGDSRSSLDVVGGALTGAFTIRGQLPVEVL